jgi:hypothetical protein
VYNIQARRNYTHKLPSVKGEETQFVKRLNKVENKVLLIGGSHARSCAHLLQDNLNSDFKIRVL